MGKEVYQNTIYSKLTKGIVGNVPNQDVPKEASPDLLNMVLRDGRMETDKGYVRMGSVLYGKPALFYQFDRKNAVNEILLFTDSVGYKWEGGIWIPLLDEIGGITTTLSSYVAGTKDLGLGAAFSLVAGDVVGVELVTGEYQVSEVDSVYTDGSSNFHIILIDDLIDDVNTGAYVRRCMGFNGNPDNPPSIVTIAAEGIIVFTNNVDEIVYYDGSKLQPIADLLTYLITCTCQSLMHMDGRLHLINTTENGIPWPHRIRSSATGNFTEFDPLAANSDASYTNLFDTPGGLLLGKVMSNFAILYKTDSIIKMTYVGTSTRTYRFDPMVSMDAAISVQSVVKKDSIHIIMGPEEIYTYSGTYDISNLSGVVKDKIYGKNGDLVNEYGRRTRAGFINTHNELWFMFINAKDGITTILWKYNLNVGGWTYRQFNDNMSIFGEFNLEAGITWESPECETDWDGDAKWNVPWTDVTLSESVSNILLAGLDKYGNYRAWVFDNGTEDDGVPIPSSYQTPEMVTIDGTFRTDNLTVKGKGGKVELQYSIDNGITWHTYSLPGYTLDASVTYLLGYADSAPQYYIGVLDNIGFATGDLLEIQLDDGTGYTVEIKGVAFPFIELTGPIVGAVSVGNKVTNACLLIHRPSLRHNKYITHKQVTSERIMFKLTTKGLDMIEPFSFEWLKVAYMEESDY